MNWFNLFSETRDRAIADASEPRESTPAYIVPSDTGRLEPGSDTWRYVSEWAQDSLTRLREKNDSTIHDATATAEIRGQIKTLKKLLALGNPKADKRRLSVEED